VPRYALLLKANANRVYGRASFALARGELDAFADALGVVGRCEQTEIAGVDYLVIETTERLEESSLAVLSNLSSLHAAFEVDGAGRFLPATLHPRVVLDDDLVSIQRYAGKTNDAFTHLLVNLALAGGDGTVTRLLAGERLRLLDPVCGRGSSLNRAALYGLDACGIDIDERDVEAYRTFLTTWLKDKRLKHRVERSRLRKGRAEPAHRVTVTYGAGKDLTTHRVIDVVHDDTVRARQHFADRSMDLLACDLPYGVHHGSRPDPTRLDRGPERLLEAALPEWFALLRPGAGAALAWNRRVLDRARLCELAASAGFRARAPDSEAFVHTVDRSITRDVLVLHRPS
jgi:SAM-dependent methyltransferase